MTLTKEDLEAIRALIKEEVRTSIKEEVRTSIKEEVRTLFKEEIVPLIKEEIRRELEPIRETLKQILKAQIEIVERIDNLERQMRFVMSHLNLTSRSSELRKILNDLD